ncbi:NAD-dependent epimerase/dehydratase family protein [Hydrogenophaga sp.]|uniref:NAD-dependent epimerase/dehydratase family protein n=1 Tax=Hydrogenophaga sp. TaxID=1904254 RepID=UPI0035643EB7
MQKNKQVLVLGASGDIGGEVARQLREAGWQVRALKRALGVERRVKDGIEWVEGDAMNRADVMAASAGCSVIVHAVNPPGYRRWAELVLPMIDNSIAAARAQGATVVLPGTVYNYGPGALESPTEDSPQRPTTRKGAIRVELEQHLETACSSGEMRAIVVRAGDFFGPKAGNSWFTQGMVKPGQPVKTVRLPSSRGVGHQFAYLPDVARTMVELLARRATLPGFATFHMAGHWDADGTQLGQAVQRVLARHGQTQPALKPFPWWMVRVAAPFVPTLREMLEMRYLWQCALRMPNQRLLDTLGQEPYTPWDKAIEATLVGIGCLKAPDSARMVEHDQLAQPKTVG